MPSETIKYKFVVISCNLHLTGGHYISDLYAYFAAQVQIATIGDCKINLGTEMPTVADIGHTAYPTNLGTTGSYWEIDDENENEGEFSLNSYYMGFKPLETPKIVSPNGDTMPVSMDYVFYEVEHQLASGNMNPGGTFAASGSTNAPFSDDKTVGKYGWIQIFVKPYYATLNLPSGVTVTGNTSSSAMGVLESGTNSIKLSVDAHWNITLPDNVKGTSNLSGRTTSDNTTDYFYLSKEGYELAGYKLTYSYRFSSDVTTDERFLYFGGSGSTALDVDEANGLLYADIQVAYCTGIQSQLNWSGYKDLVGGVTITPIFRSVTPFTFTSSVAGAAGSILTTNGKYFNLVIDNIDTNYVKEIDLSNIIINAVRNSAESEGVKDIPCNPCKLLITNGGVKLVNGEGNEIKDQETGDPVIICSGGNIKQVKIPVNYINAETGKYTDYFCFGISKNSETGSYISYKNVFDVECGNPSANTSYKKTIDIGANEKYHYLGIRLDDTNPDVKIIDNFDTKCTDGIEFLEYKDVEGNSKYVADAPFGGALSGIEDQNTLTYLGTVNNVQNGTTAGNVGIRAYKKYDSAKTSSYFLEVGGNEASSSFMLAGVAELNHFSAICVDSGVEVMMSNGNTISVESNSPYSLIYKDDLNYIYFTNNYEGIDYECKIERSPENMSKFRLIREN